MKTTMKSNMEPKTDVKVKLVQEDGNAFYILNKVSQAMREAGVDKDLIDSYLTEARAGNYDHLLQTTMEYVDVE